MLDLWFSEFHAPDAKLSILVKEQLYSEQTSFQKIDFFDSETFGKFFTLDGLIMITEKDEFIYHEMISNVPMAVNPDIKKVLIIGGGDGGTAREVCRFKTVEQVDMVEIDERVVRLCQKYFPQTACALDNDPRINLIFGDGLKFVQDAPEGAYDLILVDSTDPLGPGEGLFIGREVRNMSQSLWPEGKKSAAMFTFDLDGDIIWQNMSSDEPNTEKLIRARSIGQYGPNRCVDMILDLLDKYQVKATFFVPGYVAEHNPDVIRRIDAAGHEIGNHGYTHERFVEKTVEEQLEILKKTQKVIKDITGKEPKGFRTPSGDWHVRTPYLLNELGFLYSSSMRGDDVPYYTVLDGKETDLVEIPSKWELDDYVAQAYSAIH